MFVSGRILLADDEDTFLRSTARLLRGEGYECDCAHDGIVAADMLSKADYDLLITDIKMPGNSNLELVRDLSRTARGLPVILLTGYPAVNTAVQSIQLPVSAYMVKPLDFDELLEQVRNAIKNHNIFRSVVVMRQNLRHWLENLEKLEASLKIATQQGDREINAEIFIDLSFQNVAGALSDLKHLTQAVTAGNARQKTCHLLNCPTLTELTRALANTIKTLEKTRSQFKSKELGELRRQLESVLNSEA